MVPFPRPVREIFKRREEEKKRKEEEEGSQRDAEHRVKSMGVKRKREDEDGSGDEEGEKGADRTGTPDQLTLLVN